MDTAAVPALSTTNSEGELATSAAKPMVAARTGKPGGLETILKKLDWLLLPCIGIVICVAMWALIAGREKRIEMVDDFGDKVVKVQRVGISPDLPSPIE